MFKIKAIIRGARNHPIVERVGSVYDPAGLPLAVLAILRSIRSNPASPANAKLDEELATLLQQLADSALALHAPDNRIPDLKLGPRLFKFYLEEVELHVEYNPS